MTYQKPPKSSPTKAMNNMPCCSGKMPSEAMHTMTKPMDQSVKGKKRGK